MSHPVVVFTKIYILAKGNCTLYNKELIKIIQTFEEW
jgi:hypothetical protein